MPGGPELFIILFVILLVFGTSRLPKLARSMRQADKEFKTRMREGFKDQPVEGPCPFCGSAVADESKFCPGCGKSAEDIVAEKNRKEASSA